MICKDAMRAVWGRGGQKIRASLASIRTTNVTHATIRHVTSDVHDISCVRLTQNGARNVEGRKPPRKGWKTTVDAIGLATLCRFVAFDYCGFSNERERFLGVSFIGRLIYRVLRSVECLVNWRCDEIIRFHEEDSEIRILAGVFGMEKDCSGYIMYLHDLSDCYVIFRIRCTFVLLR